MAAFASPINYESTSGGNSMDRFNRSATNSLAGGGTGAFNFGQGMVAGGQANLSPVQQWYMGLLRGGPQAQAALSPQVADINARYGQQQQQQAQLYGRGGGRASLMAGLPFQEQADINRLYTGLLPSAAAGATNAAGLQMSTGLGESQLGQAGLLGALRSQLERRGQNLQERGQNIGLALGLVNAGAGAMSQGGAFGG